jgi:hypothetical protein
MHGMHQMPHATVKKGSNQSGYPSPGHTRVPGIRGRDAGRSATWLPSWRAGLPYDGGQLPGQRPPLEQATARSLGEHPKKLTNKN